MDRRERHIGSITTRAGDDGAKVVVDVGALVRRLLLFEHCTLESDGLVEIPRLYNAFGFKDLMALPESGALSIICDSVTMGNIGQTSGLKVTRARGGTLPLCSYRIVPVSIPERLETGELYRGKYVDQALDVIRKMGLKDSERRRLMRVLASMLDTYPRIVVNDSKDRLRTLVEREDPTIRKALEVEFRRARGRRLPGAVELRLDDLGDGGDFRVSTNLASRAGIDERATHMIVERALLGAAGLEQRILVMEATESVPGFREEELPVLEERYGAAGKQLSGEAQEARFQRVVSIGRDLPDLNKRQSGERIDLRRVLKLRDSPDRREMRDWLRKIDSESDTEINKRLFGFREGLKAATHTRSKTAIRLVLTNAVGLLPVYGSAAGPAAGAADRLIFEKWIGRPRPTTFLGRGYTSIFRRQAKHGIPTDE
jgi:hypothetical protein